MKAVREKGKGGAKEAEETGREMEGAEVWVTERDQSS